MNLLEIRQQFVKVSGRYDLVVDAYASDWTDQGANFYIQSGQLALDQRVEMKMSEATYYKKLIAGQVGCTFPDCRAVREVWVQDLTGNVDDDVAQYSGDSRFKLAKRSRDYMRTKYSQQFQNLTQSGPKDYYLPGMRIFPDSITITEIESYIGWMDIPPLGSRTMYNGVIVLPPPDHEIVLEIIGLFCTPKLTVDTDENFWSVNYPTVLLWAALKELEITYRNSEGAKDWERAITERLVDLDKDNVEEMIADVDQMEG